MENIYSINVNPNEKLAIKIASGNPLMTKGPGQSVRFYSTNNFVLHLLGSADTNGAVKTLAILTPAQETR
jgi:hypothetical protein